MDYLPNNATIDEACEWLQHQTGQKWTLPRLLEDGHLTPYVWIDYAPGLPQIFGDRLEGYLTMMVYHGDVMRLAADRNEALLTMFTAHDGTLARTEPGWRVELKDVRFQKQDIQRVAEIINKTAPALSPATPAPVVAETTEQRRARWLDWYGKGERGAVQRVYERELLLNPKADRSFIGKEIDKAKNEKAETNRGGAMFRQLVKDGTRMG